MTLSLIEGFDAAENLTKLATKGWNTTGTTGAFGINTGRLSGHSLEAASLSSFGKIRKILPAASTQFVVGFALQIAAVPSANTLIWICDSTTGPDIVYIRVDTAGRITAGSPTVQHTGTKMMNAGEWHYVEVKCVINGASGSVQTHVDGIADLATTTVNLGSTSVDRIGPFSDVTGGQRSNLFDDVYFLDTTSAPNNDFLGDVRVETIVPSAAGNSTVWTPNTGANYAAVDEMSGTFPDDDTTYVSSGTPGDIDTYTYEDLTIDTGVCFGVQTNLYARKDDAGVRQIAPVIRQSGTDYIGSTKTLSTSYAFHSQLYETDPTAATWTISTVNADEFGVKEIA